MTSSWPTTLFPGCGDWLNLATSEKYLIPRGRCWRLSGKHSSTTKQIHNVVRYGSCWLSQHGFLLTKSSLYQVCIYLQFININIVYQVASPQHCQNNPTIQIYNAQTSPRNFRWKPHAPTSMPSPHVAMRSQGIQKRVVMRYDQCFLRRSTEFLHKFGCGVKWLESQSFGSNKFFSKCVIQPMNFYIDSTTKTPLDIKNVWIYRYINTYSHTPSENNPTDGKGKWIDFVPNLRNNLDFELVPRNVSNIWSVQIFSLAP